WAHGSRRCESAVRGQETVTWHADVAHGRERRRSEPSRFCNRGCGFTTVCSRTCASHDGHIVGSTGSSWAAIGRVRFVVVTPTDRGNSTPPPRDAGAPPRHCPPVAAPSHHGPPTCPKTGCARPTPP